MGANPTKILLTHAHIDHAGAPQPWRATSAFLLLVQKEDDFDPTLPQQSMTPDFPTLSHHSGQWLNDDTVTVGDVTLRLSSAGTHRVVFDKTAKKPWSATLFLTGRLVASLSQKEIDEPVSSIREKLFPCTIEFIWAAQLTSATNVSTNFYL